MDAISAVTYRPLTGGEHELLLEASVGNFNWKVRWFTREHVLARPDLARYTVLEPDRGDFGLVVERGGRPVGVAWALYLPESSPGYGWIEESTPEFCIWVDERHRGLGIGRALVTRMLAEAGGRSVPRVSLSVDRGNLRARMLYLDLGFAPVPGGELHGVLLWQDPAARTV